MPIRHHILILVENLPVPFDRRVWQEAQALCEAGYEVSVICPKGKGYDKAYEVMGGIHIYRHRLREADSTVGYMQEYFTALCHQVYLSFRIRWRRRIDVIQACNPPDLMFLVALIHKVLFGTFFVFDHHDLGPELYLSKFGRKDFLYWLMCFLERQTFRIADASIATNETFRDIAVARGSMNPDRVVVVKSYPEAAKFKRAAPDRSLFVPGKHLVGYLGIMGAQDGVETLLRAIAEVLHVRKRDDINCIIIGDGPELNRLKDIAAELDLGSSVRFTGYLSGPSLIAHLSALSIGVIPDPPNEFNDKLSMNKVFEYMMLGLPFVQFNLRQATREAGNAALVVQEHSPRALTDGILALIDDPERRRHMALSGRAIAEREFRWPAEARRYLEVYRNLLLSGLNVNDQRHYPAS
ncbi:glycosyltransferase family 4 protein [Sinorhizobium meliloti]|uniref:Glycosyltransferase n=1 Tax=Rhizobium meliloti TaxID=382 RepID=A0AAW9TJY6_RHIML|nr:glycosyltransferase family 4 protein [Sinorhizobium meliloti]ASP95359.1 glycosyltransferase WbuB [Sinorhizobium meliloti]MDE3764951.1 glycosyltransferase family 4 protein [Sinorhizobium meliloti]MDE3778721.1 glycosyltransferase family 4 protein [Sinorhizobium meliloti]MDE3802902.1 glycosyltransferase family 4 protein [Sinorhizobium meliloti]MQW31987.1 glycosyltransferase [Sinorhizobium meliloti]